MMARYMNIRALLFCYYLVTLRGSFSQSCPPVADYSAVPGEGAGVVIASWLPPPSDSNVTGFQLRYGLMSSSSLSTPAGEPVMSNGRLMYNLSGLLNFADYRVMVRADCSGTLGPELTQQVQTIPTVPSAKPEQFRYVDLGGAGLTVVNISWSPIPESQWNGIPGGYYVYLFRSPESSSEEIYIVPYPSTSLLIGVPHGRYAIHIAAFNDVGQSDQALVSEQLSLGNMIPSEDRFVDYPFFYILIPGVIFLVITVTIVIVICKKVREGRKGAITFARDIDGGSLTYGSKGYGNAMQLHELSPQSPNASTTIPVSSGSMATSPAFSLHQQQSFHQHLANRPLPLSPHSDPTMQLPEEVFTASATPVTHMPPTRMMTHPGPLPMLEENVEQASFVPPMTRTLTEPSLGSVFSPVSNTSGQLQQHMPPGQQQALPSTQPQQQRGRSNTLPSPYEVPDTNGNMMPHDIQSRPSQHRMADMAEGGAVIPPPPSHSPPPFTHSAQDINQMSADEGHAHHHQQHGHRQNTLPRSMPNQRSLSTSAASGRSIGPKGMSYMKSDGNIHEPLEGEGLYPLMDSDLEHQEGVRHQSSLERARHPPHSHHPHNHHQPPSSSSSSSRHPGMINGALASSSDQFGANFGPMGEGLIPIGMQSYPVPRGGKDKSEKRESLFSETSTELSVSSNSGDPLPQPRHPNNDRPRKGSVFSDSDMSMTDEASPGGWDYRGTKSDLGRRQRSRSPPERETFSEVGHMLHNKQNGFV